MLTTQSYRFVMKSDFVRMLLFSRSRKDFDLSVEIKARNIVYEPRNNKPNYRQLPIVDFLCQHSAGS